MTTRKRYESDKQYNISRKERYKKDSEYREKVKARIKKYQQTEKGKEAYKKALAKFRKNNPNYMATYMKKRRDYGLSNKLCVICLSKNNDYRYLTCRKCRDNDNQKNAKKRSEKIKQRG